MSGLSERHKVMGEKLFEMESGYVNIRKRLVSGWI
jgi:hypothetical protein